MNSYAESEGMRILSIILCIVGLLGGVIMMVKYNDIGGLVAAFIVFGSLLLLVSPSD